ncbi:hypothetical protein AT15_07990 [Kosmotoga arenicorallina S304]|uniref:Dihydrolipoyl dehydrogenase n=1 Tax=Kosmotoga arenicorallina S304 TaxID=1453497 RepID=A0A182C7D9_9BACT|nr:dihydrolipoyl dehydrogenase [Kosmotoga arenicorallina]OAA31427.1 hypothetical protein AT15_07990 [Kosmotoga arenicorallina S304]
MEKFDVVVIGGGPGGSDCAIRLAQRGKKVAIVEQKFFGGTCTNVGCIPTKALLHASGLYAGIKERGKRLGLSGELSFDLNGMKKHMERSVMMSRKGTEALLKKNGVSIIKGTACFDKDSFYIEESGELLKGEYFVVATGSKPRIPEPLKVEGLWSSDDVFTMESIPESIVIIGGGVIGIEMATLFSNLGSSVTVVEMMNRLLPAEDIDVSKTIEKSLSRRGIKILLSTVVEKIEKQEKFNIVLNDKSELVSDRVLVSIGREPVIPRGLEKALSTERGAIVTDENFRSSIPNILAIGDVRGKVMLAHVASAEGIAVAEKLSGKESEIAFNAFPSVVYSTPEVASVGIKEGESGLKKGLRSFIFPMSANGRANTMGEREGFVKLIVNDKNIIVGGSLIGAHVSEIMMEVVLAVKKGLTLEDLTSTIHPHPTIAEAIRDAAEGLEGNPLHI